MLKIVVGVLLIAIGGWISGNIWKISHILAVFALLITSASGGYIFYQGVRKRQRGRRVFQDDLAPNTLIRIIPWDRFRVLFIDDDGKERFLLLNAPLPKGKTCFRAEAVGRQIRLEPIADLESSVSEAFEMPDDYKPA